MMETRVDLAIRSWVQVDASVEWAFDAFTHDVQDWWPLATHSVRARSGLGRPEELHLEPWAGGRFYEKTGRSEPRWGRVLVWDPPSRLVLEWQDDPALPPTMVEVTFTADDEGDTRVDLVHSGWEMAGREGEEARQRYGGARGWDAVLGRYVEAVGA